MAGRKPKLTPELQKDLCDLLKAGNYINATCDYVGIDPSTFYRWMEWGERGWKKDRDRGFVRFYNAVKKARASAETESVFRIRQAAQGEQVVKRRVVSRPDGTEIIEETITPPQWTADAWFLERSFPDRWGKRQVDVTHGVNQELALRIDDLVQAARSVADFESTLIDDNDQTD